MTIAATTDVPVTYDVTFDAWVIDVKPACVNATAGAAIRLDVSNNYAGPSGAGRTRAAGEHHVDVGHQPTAARMNNPSAPAGCAVLPVRRAWGLVRRRLRGHLVCCTRAAAPARAHLLEWRRRRRRRRGGIAVGEKKTKKAASTSAAERRRQELERDRDEKLRDAISYCKMTMGITPGD